MATNLVTDIAQYAVEVDQIVKALAKERDDFKFSAECMEKEIQSLRRRIDELQSVRKPDKSEETR